MDDRTRAATYEDVTRVAQLLEEEGVEYALIGGYALALQGIVRLTEDVDILVEPSLENSRRWVRALSKLPDGAAKELVGDETLHEELYAIRINDEFTVDVMNSASGLSWTDLAPYRRRIDGIQVMSLEGLLRMKSHGRLKDQADAEMIRKALGIPGDG
ncbi:MAG: hypothetical protein JST00_33490 [Deltaproteobacteria bacterium]|nr:hypothetical protein [Deltaproteobacteria bacterium]